MSGAVAVLFLFVIIMINVELAELNAVGTEYTQNVPLAFILGSVFSYELLSIIPYKVEFLQNLSDVFLGAFTKSQSIFFSHTPINTSSNVDLVFNPIMADISFNSTLQIQSVGNILYTHTASWLIAISVILLLALVGPISLTISRDNTQ